MEMKESRNKINIAFLPGNDYYVLYLDNQILKNLSQGHHLKTIV